MDETPAEMTVPEVAAFLRMSPDGVYKLIQRGRLPAERRSPRKTVVARHDLDAFVARQRDTAAAARRGAPVADVETLTAEFVAATKLTPEAWIAAWKGGQRADTPENMDLLVRAVALRATSTGEAPVEQPAEHRWAEVAFEPTRARSTAAARRRS